MLPQPGVGRFPAAQTDVFDEQFDPSSQQFYYVQRSTREARWQLPDPSSLARQPAEWHGLHDASTGQRAFALRLAVGGPPPRAFDAGGYGGGGYGGGDQSAQDRPSGAKGWEDRSHGNASQDVNDFDQGRSRRRRGASPEGGADSTADYGGAES